MVVSVTQEYETRVDAPDDVVNGPFPPKTGIGVMLVFFDAFGVPDNGAMETSEELIIFDDDRFSFAPTNVLTRDRRYSKLTIGVIEGVYVFCYEDGRRGRRLGRGESLGEGVWGRLGRQRGRTL